MLYESTTVAAGRAVAIVVATGDDTEARRGAGGKAERAVGGVELRLKQLMAMTGPVALGAGAGVVFAGLIRGRKMSDLVSSAVSLAVGSVPEGLPLLASAAQLAAAQRLSAKGALVRRARSVEALGRVDVLCFDKTGTVTEGRMAVHSVSDGATEERLVAASDERLETIGVAVRATPLRRHDGAVSDPTDEAVRIAGQACDLDRMQGLPDWERVDELPFEPGRGYHAVVGRVGAGHALSVKGAPEALLSACVATRRGGAPQPLDERGREKLFAEAAALARRGLRVLAVAERQCPDAPDPAALEELVFHGFLALSDPVRPTAAAALSEIRRAGVEVVMITGDHPSTASAIAAELDLMRGRQVMTGAELSRLDDTQLVERIPTVAAFARVTPAQKVRVVRTLQRMNRVVAMAGDGANDAPAMRLANVGIAIGPAATAAARASADVIVMDGRMETIVEALIEGRAMWASVREAVSILVGGNFGEIAFSLGGGLVDGRPPLSARQLLLVNLLTDVAPAMAIAVRPPADSERVRLQEEGPDASLSQPLNRAIATRAAATAIGASAAWGVGRLTGSVARARTIGLVALVGSQLAQTLTMADRDRSVLVTGLGSAAILAAIVQTPFVSGAFGCRPLGPLGWTIALSGSALGAYAGTKLPKYLDAYEPQIRKQLTRFRNTSVVRAISREMPLLPEVDPATLYEEG
jgi:cation-transporting P-type ATPase I